MANRKNTFLLKRSSVAGKVPLAGDLLLGELAINTSDAILYASGTTSNSILPIGWDRIYRTGDTVTGDFLFNGDIQISGSSQPSGYALSVTGDTNFLGDVYVNGDLYYDGSVSITGSTIIENGLTANTIYTDYIDFNTNYSGNPQQVIGRLNWSIDDGTLEIGMGGVGEVTQQIGLEQFFLVKNQSGSQLDKGKVIRASGTLGNSSRILADYMIADNTIPYYFTLGIATQDIDNGDDGYITKFGLIRGVNTTGSLYSETWVDGDILYLSPTILGGLTKFEPNEPNLKIQMALVIKANANGSMFVRPDLGSRLEDLHDLQTSGATNGDLISFDSLDSIWKYSKTLNGNYIVNGSLSATTFLGDGSNLTNIDNFYTTGATFNGNVLEFNRNDNLNAYNIDLSDKLRGSFGLTVDGSSSVITIGQKGYAIMPYDGTITGWSVISDQIGNCVLDVWKSSGGTIPTLLDTITGTEKPTLTSQQINSDLTLTSWTTSVNIGDVVAFNVDSASTITRVHLTIYITKQ